MHIIARIRKREPARMPLSLRNRCISVLLAYVMLVGPAGYEHIAHASTQYSDLGTSSWGTHNRIIEYGEWDGTSGRTGNFTPGYDANGSVTKKITWNTHSTTTDPIDHTKIEEVTYEYNLQNRLKKVTTLPYDELGNPLTAQQSVVKYIYNTDGILVQKIKDPDGSVVTTIYLIDSYNHTGYAQTLEEMTFNALDPDPVNDIPASRKTYTIGDDMLTEATAEHDGTEWTYYAAEHLMYDGHGSTRQLVSGSVGSTNIVDDFSYDGYGVMLQDEDNFPPNGTQAPGKLAQKATNLLYAGEHFDTDSQNYYLRARWYDSLSGRFNRMDPFDGNNQDPQSLHKYLYAHANPINNIDPSGRFSLTEVLSVNKIVAIAIGSLAPAIITAYETAKTGASWWEIGRNAAIAWGLAFALGIGIALVGPYILQAVVSVISQILGISAGMAKIMLSVAILAFSAYGAIKLWRSDYPLSVKISVTVVLALAFTIAFCAKNNIKTGGRLGKPSTREQNGQVAKQLKKRGYRITGGGGERPEEYIPGSGPGTSGGNYIDITAQHKETGRIIRINTVDTLSDGVTPTSREAGNAAMIRSKLPPGDHLVLIPKVGD